MAYSLPMLRRRTVRLAATWIDSAVPSFTRSAIVGGKNIAINTQADVVHLALTGAADRTHDPHSPLLGIVWC